MRSSLHLLRSCTLCACITPFDERTLLHRLTYLSPLFRTRIPPDHLLPLVQNYQDGYLLPHLDPRAESVVSLSPMPWTLRSAAPTDYELVQKRFPGKEICSSYESTMIRHAVEKHQTALNASGCHPSRLELQRDISTRWMKNRNVMLIGMVLFVGTLLLAPLNESSTPLMGASLFVSLQSIQPFKWSQSKLLLNESSSVSESAQKSNSWDTEFLSLQSATVSGVGETASISQRPSIVCIFTDNHRYRRGAYLEEVPFRSRTAG